MEALWFWLFILAWLCRYVRLIVNTLSFLLLKPLPVSIHPAYSPSDVTVIIPTTFTQLEDLLNCLVSIIACSTKKIILVTSNAKLAAAREFCNVHKLQTVQVIGVVRMGKRIQMSEGLSHVRTPIVAFADDDVIWPKGYVPHFLAPFANLRIGAVGTNQRVVRNKGQPFWSNFWNILAICYLERRTFLTGAVNNIDGGMSTLSGRTAIYRSEILQNKAFYDAFLNDCWRGQRLNGDDDKFLTKWTYSRGWKIHYQFSNDMPLMTTLETTSNYLQQCVRWARGHWRGNFNVMRCETYWYRIHVWTLYATYIASFQTPALLVDGIMIMMLNCGLEGHSNQTTAIFVLVCWILFAKIIKMIPHFCRHPSDMKFIPVLLAFSYLHGFINLYALCTMHATGWGSRVVDTTAAPDVVSANTSPGSIPNTSSSVTDNSPRTDSKDNMQNVTGTIDMTDGYVSESTSAITGTNGESQVNDPSRRRPFDVSIN